MIKLNITPFHFWLPLISRFLPWNIFIVLLTLQKIIPFYLIFLIKINNFLIIHLILILSSIIPPLSCININNLKIIIAYSSINQSRWIILIIYTKILSWLIYFTFYSITLISLIFIFNFFKISKNFSIKFLNNKLNLNLILILILFNIAGLPPFSFFFIKWYSIFIFIKLNKLFSIILIIIIRSLFILFIYSNILYHSLFLFKFESKLIKPIINKNYNPIYFYLILPLSISIIILII